MVAFGHVLLSRAWEGAGAGWACEATGGRRGGGDASPEASVGPRAQCSAGLGRGGEVPGQGGVGAGTLFHLKPQRRYILVWKYIEKAVRVPKFLENGEVLDKRGWWQAPRARAVVSLGPQCTKRLEGGGESQRAGEHAAPSLVF